MLENIFNPIKKNNIAIGIINIIFNFWNFLYFLVISTKIIKNIVIGVANQSLCDKAPIMRIKKKYITQNHFQ